MKINGDEGDELVALREENARLRAALKEAVYEATHLSPQETDGSHWAKMSAAWLTRARAALDPQDAEIARLKAEVESYKAGNKDLLDWFNNLKADFDTLRAEIERLRAALEEIAAAKPQQISDTGFQQGPLSLWMWAKRTARAALEEAPQGRISEAAAQPAPPQETDNAE